MTEIQEYIGNLKQTSKVAKDTKQYFDYMHLLKAGILQIEQATFVSLLFPAAVILRSRLAMKESTQTATPAAYCSPAAATSRSQLPAAQAVTTALRARKV